MVLYIITMKFVRQGQSVALRGVGIFALRGMPALPCPTRLGDVEFMSYICSGKLLRKMEKVIISGDVCRTLAEVLGQVEYDRLFVLCDETTRRLCYPVLEGMEELQGAVHITIGATDTHKTLRTMEQVWTEMGRGGGTRHSLMLNLGGGMVTDLGGFAASTFKRGIPFINIPTTLLSMVDASVGGKTGINFGGLKNEIGVFNQPLTVVIDTQFLRTMDAENVRSGYAEMLKHGLISDTETYGELMGFDLDRIDYKHLADMVGRSVAVKERIVEEDPTERGIRKALNLGHTVGHAFESFALQFEGMEDNPRGIRPFLHGYAVAWGLVCELYLSCVKTGFPTDIMRQAVQFIREAYGSLPITCDDYPQLYDYMTHDKKNTAGTINFTLLGGIGDIRINQTATKEEIYEMLDFFREGL